MAAGIDKFIYDVPRRPFYPLFFYAPSFSTCQQFPLRSYSFDFIGFSVRTAGLPIEGARMPLRPLLEG